MFSQYMVQPVICGLEFVMNEKGSAALDTTLISTAQYLALKQGREEKWSRITGTCLVHDK